MWKFIFITVFGSSVWASVPEKNTFPEGEKLVYSKLVQAYQKNDVAEFTKQQKILKDNYPFSIHLDGSYYMLGSLEFQQEHFGEALRAFDQVVNRYSQSSKRSAALFAMGMTYKKLNLPNQAKAVFQRVIDVYPGSPDSQRAWMELRLTEKEMADSKNE